MSDLVIDPELLVALAPVLRDVAATSSVVLDVRRSEIGDSPDGRSAMVWGPSGGGSSVWFVEGMSSVEQIATVADRIQEMVIEELWHAGRPVSWPPCPSHPNGHPLEAAAVGSRAVWRCPKSTDVFNEVGHL